MTINPLPFGTRLSEYEQQSEQLLQAWRARDPDAVELVRHHLPQFLRDDVPWLPKNLSDEELFAVPLDSASAQLALARRYSFQDWQHLVEWVQAIHEPGSQTAHFETAVNAVIEGDTVTLGRLLQENPGLVHARSGIVTHHDPPRHRATLLHYIAANGVEDFRQKTPPNAVEIARILLDGASEPDSLADMYGGQCTTMSMLVSSSHPAQAGVQIPLVDLLIDYGASPNATGKGDWMSPLLTALTFGFLDVARTLFRRGATLTTLAAAAGLGLLGECQCLLLAATTEDRHRALALAAQSGHADIVRLLLDTGEDPNRFNPPSYHSHSTPLHQAALAGHIDVVRLLVERGARLDIADTIWKGTPLGWALHNGQTETADFLRSKSQIA